MVHDCWINTLVGAMSSVLIFIGLVLLVAYGSWGLTLFFMQPKLLYSPVREITCTPQGSGLVFEDVVFETNDGLKLRGWHVPAENSEFTILFCHGNAGNMMHRLDTIGILHNLGANCFIFDYRGYGQSEGKPNEKGTYVDAVAAYRWLKEEKEVPSDRIVIFGRSLGGSRNFEQSGASLHESVQYE